MKVQFMFDKCCSKLSTGQQPINSHQSKLSPSYFWENYVKYIWQLHDLNKCQFQICWGLQTSWREIAPKDCNWFKTTSNRLTLFSSSFKIITCLWPQLQFVISYLATSYNIEGINLRATRKLRKTANRETNYIVAYKWKVYLSLLSKFLKSIL